MRVSVRSGQLGQIREGIPVYGALEGENKFERLLPTPSSSSLGSLLKGIAFRGLPNEIALLPWQNRWVLVVGLGKEKKLSLETVREFAGTASSMAKGRGFKHVLVPVLKHKALGTVEQVAQAVVEGALLALYRYDRLRATPKQERAKKLETLTLVLERAHELREAKEGVEKGAVLAEAVSLARDLINGPSNIVTPTYLANQARLLAREHHFKCQVIPFPRLKRLGFGGIVGVAQGSAHPAQFIVLDYKPARAKTTFALCGKGITFDSGGISLKPSAKMEQMKYDMSGAAAVLGILKAAATLKLPIRVVGIIAATENLPSGTAQKPGDVLKTLSGKTVEVLNTDAEGRLVLADCLHYAKRYKPDCVVDLATLTGACVVALGSEAIGLMSNNDKLAQRIAQAGKVTYERVWRLPLWEEYAPAMKSDIADLRNVTNTGEAGTITAAKFLEEFIDGFAWAHLDIAGTAWTEKDKSYVPKGAVGIGVRLLVNLIENWKNE